MSISRAFPKNLLTLCLIHMGRLNLSKVCFRKDSPTFSAEHLRNRS